VIRVRLDEIRLGIKILERVEVTSIVEKMVETRLKWFGHVERRLVDFVVRRVDLLEGFKIARGNEGTRKN
jgi:hypothetical protein